MPTETSRGQSRYGNDQFWLTTWLRGMASGMLKAQMYGKRLTAAVAEVIAAHP